MITSFTFLKKDVTVTTTKNQGIKVQVYNTISKGKFSITLPSFKATPGMSVKVTVPR